MLTQYIQLLSNRSFLTKEEAEEAMTIILDKEVNSNQIAAFLSILSYRGEIPDEVAGMGIALKKKSLSVHLSFPVLDIVGTGGDRANTVNISTGASILAAACGVPIAKHGNRSVSSKSGSADVLEAFGVDLYSSPEKLIYCLNKIGIGFMYAPLYHPSLKKLAPIRKSLGFPTVFNILGPLLNPANAEYALIGVAKESNLELMSQVILQLQNKKRVLLFHGNGLDELTALGKVIAFDIQNNQITRLEIDPLSLGFSSCSLKELQGGDARLNASILKKVFLGEKNAIADALVFNAGAAIWIFGKVNTLEDGIQLAKKKLREGKALELIKRWIEINYKG